MARNGSGTYNLPAGNPVATGTTISSTWANNTLGDMATALTGSIASDGQTTPSANLPMGNFAHTGVGNATVRTMYAAAGQVQDNVFQYLNSVAGTNSITAVAAFGMTSYATGQRFTFVAANTNTGAVTLNINGIGAKAILKQGSSQLAASDIVAGQSVSVIYDGTQFQYDNYVFVLPTGIITMWSGTIATIPTGWYLCNGSNGTPDLRDKFIVGASVDSAGVAYTTITGANTKTGGSKDATLVSHTHTATVTDPGHNHSINNSTNVLRALGGSNGSNSGSNWRNDTISNNASTTGITVANSTEGSSATNANLVPYFALAFIMKA